MLNQVTVYLEKQHQFKKHIRQILLYPTIILLVGFLTTLAMLLFIVPRFAELFQDTQSKLPTLTFVIFYISKKLNEYIGWFILFFCISLLVFTRIPLCSKFTKKLVHQFKKLPMISKCWQNILLARFARNLSITFSAGILITDALKISAHTIDDVLLFNKVISLANKIHAGLPLYVAMENHFPILMIQMTKIGEESGMLETMLEKTADLYQSDADQWLYRLNQILEPLIMLLLGVLIGGLVISMYLPIFNLGSAL